MTGLGLLRCLFYDFYKSLDKSVTRGLGNSRKGYEGTIGQPGVNEL